MCRSGDANPDTPYSKSSRFRFLTVVDDFTRAIPLAPHSALGCGVRPRTGRMRRYARRKRPLAARRRAEVELTAHIDAIHRASRGTYGAPRVHAELAALGIHVGRKRVARLIRALGVCGRQSAQAAPEDAPRPRARPAPDLVARGFAAAGPDRL